MYLLTVSLFTREWIEISIVNINKNADTGMSPSLRGSGLKSCTVRDLQTGQEVSLFTREWIEILDFLNSSCKKEVSLFTREWIEISL